MNMISLIEKIGLINFMKAANFIDREEPESEHEKNVCVGVGSHEIKS